MRLLTLDVKHVYLLWDDRGKLYGIFDHYQEAMDMGREDALDNYGRRHVQRWRRFDGKDDINGLDFTPGPCWYLDVLGGTSDKPQQRRYSIRKDAIIPHLTEKDRDLTR